MLQERETGLKMGLAGEFRIGLIERGGTMGSPLSWRTACLGIVVFDMAVTCAMVRGQTCTPVWQPGDGLTGVSGVLCSVMWDPDGPGPQTSRPVIAGEFNAVGTHVANGVAMWSGTEWLPLGMNAADPGRGVTALVCTPTGELWAAGRLVQAGLQNAKVSKWTGSGWAAVGSVFTGNQFTDNDVKALASMPNGDIVAGGHFLQADGAPASGVARWNGAGWGQMGAGVGGVQAMAFLPDGDLVALGGPTGFSRWDEAGGTWSSIWPGLGSGLYCMLFTSDGRVFAGGSFVLPGGERGIARWDGSAWVPVGSGVTYPGNQPLVTALISMPNGDVVATGGFVTMNGIAANRIARWNGATWSALGTGLSFDGRGMVVLLDGRLLASGTYVWNGQNWSLFNEGGANGQVLAVGWLPGGDVVAAGEFTRASGMDVSHIGRRGIDGWHPMGTGMNGNVKAVLVMPNGNVIAGGAFTMAGGVAANRIARWNGSNWSPIGQGIGDGEVNALALMPDGILVAGGYFTSAGPWPALGLAQWNGLEWTGVGNFDGGVNALAVDGEGRLIAGGYISGQAVNVARWDGQSWFAYPKAPTSVLRALAVASDGTLYVGGQGYYFNLPFQYAALKWDEHAWVPLLPMIQPGIPEVRVMAAAPGGGIVLGGGFDSAGNTTLSNIGQWDGSQWVPMGSGISGPVLALAVTPTGEVAAGGGFGVAGGNISVNVARWGCPPCYANCDRSIVPPVLNVNDFQCFLNLFATGDPAANCDGSTAAPVLNVNDFQCFVNAFAVGCP